MATGKQGRAGEKRASDAVPVTVSRAALKLAGATEAFNFDFDGKVVLDIGSSTGGFTEYVISRGARKVIAIEKGTKQMKAPLRFDPKVELHEKTDIFTVTFAQIGYVDVILADVSFTSITRVLSYVRTVLAKGDVDFLVMVKPQFEAKPDQLFRGVVKNERIRREILREFEEWTRRRGFVIKAKHDNEVAGKNGNIERFYWLTLSAKNAVRVPIS